MSRFQAFMGFMARLWPTSIRRQLIVGVGLVHLVLMTLFIVDLVERQRVFLRNQDLAETKSMAHLLAINSSSWVLANDTEGLSELIRGMAQYPDLRYAMIIAPDGRVLAHTEASRKGLYLTDSASKSFMAGAPEERVITSSSRLIDVVAPVMSVGERIAWARVGISQEKNARNLTKVVRNGVIYTGLAVLFGCLFAWSLGSRLTVRLNRLLAVVGSIRQGSRDVRADITPDEVGVLGDGLNRMLNVICDQEEQVRLLLNSTAEGIYGVDMEGMCTFCNPSAIRLLGYPGLAAVHGRNMHELIHHHREDGSECSLEECRIYKSQAGNAGIYSDEEIFWRADGSSFRVEYWAYPVIRNSERIGTVVTFMDITRRKELEATLREYSENLELLVHQRTSELEEANGELGLRRAEAEEANRAKSDFLANMSHELRTPLTAVIGFSEVLQDKLFGDLNERQHRYVSAIYTSGRHLLELINEVLDLAKVESGKSELEINRFTITEFLDDMMMIFREKALRRQLSLSLEVIEDLSIEADERKLKQILFNLLSNAVKFTPDGGSVTVTAGRGIDEGTFMIEVADTGIGIAAIDLPRLFQKFSQLETTITKRYEGTGLGLVLTKRLVELHGGRISVTSEPGCGSVFTVILPVAPEDRSPVQLPDAG